jgi:hypothetical protein
VAAAKIPFEKPALVVGTKQSGQPDKADKADKACLLCFAPATSACSSKWIFTN